VRLWRRQAFIGAVLVAGISLGRGASARAQLDCGTSSEALEDLSVRPSDGATGVALDAPIVARYSAHVDLDALEQSLPGGDDPCQSQLICLFQAGNGARAPVSGSVQRIDHRTVAFAPDAPLRAHTQYIAQIARAGFDTASRTELALMTGAHADREPPVFDPAPSEIKLAVAAPPAECHAKPGSLRVALSIPRASDDGDEQSVEILLFLTRAQGLRGPVLVARANNPASDDGNLQMSFVLSATQAREPVCLSLRASDGTGKLAKGQPELCFDPTRGSFFAPCGIAVGAVGATSASEAIGSRSLLALCAIAAVAFSSRKRGRGARLA
jgi:hypothetical protein